MSQAGSGTDLPGLRIHTWGTAAALALELASLIGATTIAGRRYPARRSSNRTAVVGWPRQFARGATALGYANVLAPVGTIATLTLASRDRSGRPVAVVVLASAGAGIAVWSLRKLVPIDRPQGGNEISTSSFPSGHATMAASIYGSLGLLTAGAVPARWRPVMLVASAGTIGAVAYSRVALDRHWTPDVLVGCGVGSIWLWRVWRHVG